MSDKHTFDVPTTPGEAGEFLNLSEVQQVILSETATVIVKPMDTYSFSTQAEAEAFFSSLKAAINND